VSRPWSGIVPGGAAPARPDADLLEELRPHLRTTLPHDPSARVALPALLTLNSKAYRTRPPDRASVSAADRCPQLVEATVARTSDLLAAEAPIGVHDNLFALGGHSLTATRFVARVADTYGVNLPVHQVFVGPTVAELAEVISADPDFGQLATSSRHAELEALSDDDLDDLLRAALAQRNRRQAIVADPDFVTTSAPVSAVDSLPLLEERGHSRFAAADRSPNHERCRRHDAVLIQRL
jgi:hypothetical protein